jgi:hypothetical protein
MPAFYPTYPQNSYPQTLPSGQTYTVGSTGLGSLGQVVVPGQYNAGSGQYNSGIGSPQWVQNVQLVNQQASPSLPHPTGSYTSIAYIDPVTGSKHVIYVDNAYAQILYGVIAMQGVPFCNYTAVPTVPEGEFSLDEMGQAEDLIQEIEHAH